MCRFIVFCPLGSFDRSIWHRTQQSTSTASRCNIKSVVRLFSSTHPPGMIVVHGEGGWKHDRNPYNFELHVGFLHVGNRLLHVVVDPINNGSLGRAAPVRQAEKTTHASQAKSRRTCSITSMFISRNISASLPTDLAMCMISWSRSVIFFSICSSSWMSSAENCRIDRALGVCQRAGAPGWKKHATQPHTMSSDLSGPKTPFLSSSSKNSPPASCCPRTATGIACQKKSRQYKHSRRHTQHKVLLLFSKEFRL